MSTLWPGIRNEGSPYIPPHTYVAVESKGGQLAQLGLRLVFYCLLSKSFFSVLTVMTFYIRRLLHTFE